MSPYTTDGIGNRPKRGGHKETEADNSYEGGMRKENKREKGEIGRENKMKVKQETKDIK